MPGDCKDCELAELRAENERLKSERNRAENARESFAQNLANERRRAEKAEAEQWKLGYQNAQSELAELRDDNERLQESEKAIIGCARTWKARAEKAEAGYERVHLAAAAFVACFDEIAPLEGNDYIDVRHHLGRLREILKDNDPGTPLLDRMKVHAERRQKAEAELERARAANVALRDGLANIKSFYFVDASNEDGKRRIILAYRGDPDIAGVVFDPEYDAFELAEETERWLSDKIQKLLASPDPGERVRAVAEAAQRHFERFKGMHEINCPICEAVRALRGEEGEEDA